MQILWSSVNKGFPYAILQRFFLINVLMWSLSVMCRLETKVQFRHRVSSTQFQLYSSIKSIYKIYNSQLEVKKYKAVCRR